MREKIIVAIIAAIAAIIVAVIGTWGTIMVSGGSINENRDILNRNIDRLNVLSLQADSLADNIRTIRNMPVGTIISSMLPPSEFTRAVGDPSNFDLSRSQWTLADDKGSIPGTRWAELTNNSPVPDLRGMFLRGINSGRNDGNGDPDGDREPGHLQLDSLQEHNHRIGLHEDRDQLAYFDIGGTGADPSGTFPNGIQNIENPIFRVGLPTTYPRRSEARVTNETRPRNISVYYYIKIN